jgi:UDP-3-O-acyl-N-acetylglucosamine deacetylase
MTFEFERTTLRGTARFEGVGIHTGTPCTVTVEPGDDAIAFWNAGSRFAAKPSSITDTPRSTILGPVRTIEHLMSALAGIGITDAEIHVQGDELPILDGGALDFVEGLKSVGSEPTGKRSAFSLYGRVNLQDAGQTMHVSVGEGRWRYVYDAGDRFPGVQSFEIRLSADRYASEIAPARTFAFDEEIAAIQAAGLGLGGDARNTLVVGREGYLTEAKWPDEPARHKLLDCIGDLALAGVPPRFLNVVAERSGHSINVQAAARLSELCRWED